MKSSPVIAVIEAAADGALLLPAESNLGLFGMHALAAARRTALYRPLLRTMRALPDDDIEWLFGIDTGRTLPPILLSTFDGDASPLIEAAMSPRGGRRDAIDLWLVLARLTFDGAIERTQMKALLERFERENLAQAGRPRVEGLADGDRYPGPQGVPGANTCRLGGRAAIPSARLTRRPRTGAIGSVRRRPGDAKRFEEQFLTPIGDPVEELSRFEWTDDTAGTRTGIAAGQDNLMPSLASLDGDEMRWLERYLERHFTDADFAWEAIDGVCCAIACGHASAQPPNILELLDIGTGIEFDSPRQETFVNGLLTRYLAGVRRLLAAGGLHRPPLAQYAEYPRGAAWAACFLRVVTLDPNAGSSTRRRR